MFKNETRNKYKAKDFEDIQNKFLAENSKQAKDLINSMKNSTYNEKQISAGKHNVIVGEITKDSKLKEKSSQYGDDEKDTCEGSDTDSITEIKNRNIVHSRIKKYESSNDESYATPHKDSSQLNEPFHDYSISFNEGVGGHFKDNKQNELVDSCQCGKNVEKLHSGEHQYGQSSNVIAGNKNVLKLLSKRHLSNLNIKIDRDQNNRKHKISDNKWRETMGSFRASKTGVRTSFRSSRKRRRNILTREENSQDFPYDEKGVTDSNTKETLFFRTELSHGCNRLSKEIENEIYSKTDNTSVNHSINHNTTGFPALKILSRSKSSSPIERGPVPKKICSSVTKLNKVTNKCAIDVLLNKSDSIKENKNVKHSVKTNNRSVKENVDKDSSVKLKKKNSRCSRKSEYRVSVTIRPNSVADLSNKFNSIILQNKSTTISNSESCGTVCKEKGITLSKFYISPRASFKRKYRHKVSKCVKGQRNNIGHNTIALDDTIKEGYYSSFTRKSLSNSLTELNMKDLFEEGDYNKTDEEKVCERIKTALSSGMFRGETEESEEEFQKTKENITLVKTDLESSTLNKEAKREIQKVDNSIGESSEDSNPISEVHSSQETHLNITESINNSISMSENDISLSSARNNCIMEVPNNQSCLSEDLSNDFTSIDTNKSTDSGIHSISVISHISELGNNHDTVIQKNIYADSLCSESCNKSEEVTHSIDTFQVDAVDQAFSQSSETNKLDKPESKIYSSILSAVKNTMKKTKEKDTVRRVSQDKSLKDKKWFKRSKSKERKNVGILRTEKSVLQISRDSEELTVLPVTCVDQKDISPEVLDDKVLPHKLEIYSTTVKNDKQKQEKSNKRNKDTFYGRFLFGNKSKNKFVKINDSADSEIHNYNTDNLKLEKDQDETSIQYKLPIDADSLISVAQTNEDIKEETANVQSLNSSSNQYSTINHTLVKTIPPPPKNPIPSPPVSFKKQYSEKLHSSSVKYIRHQSKSSDVDIHIDIENVKDHKPTPEDNGMHPNSSFLWSSAAQASKSNTYHYQSINYNSLSEIQTGEDNEYDQLSKFNQYELKNESNFTPNYSEIDNLTDEEEEIVNYDGSGATSVLSYDEIKPPSSCSYDDIYAPPRNENTHSTALLEGYDPVNPPADIEQYDYVGTVTAKLAVVNENQIESLCYEYDDIAAYNVSLLSHSYEPVCLPTEPQDLNHTSHNSESTGSTKRSIELFEDDKAESEEESEDVHEVFSYEITNLGKSHVVEPRSKKVKTGRKLERKPKAGISRYNIKATIKNPYSHCIDVTDIEALSIQVPLECLQKRRSKRTQRRVAWTQGVRRYDRSHINPSFTCRKKRSINNRESRPRTWTLRNFRADTDNEDETCDHYEAIYEVINPTEGDHVEVEDSVVDEIYSPDVDLNDSFDSDDSSEAYCRLEPLSSDGLYSGSRCLSESGFGEKTSNELHRKYNRSISYQPNNMNKIAEAANSGMKKLRRNWSHTKHEVRTGLSKIKKKSTFSASDISQNENIYEETSPAASDKSKWSFKSHFRRKLSTSSSQSDISKESKTLSLSSKTRPTFYLTLTIAPDNQDDLNPSVQTYEELLNHRKISAPSLTSSTLNINSSQPDFLLKSKSTSSVPKRTVSARSIPGAPSRPTIAPPAPPAVAEKYEVDEEDSQEISKHKLAMKLNQILSSGPTMPPGRRVLRSSDCPELQNSSPSLDHIHNSKNTIQYAYINPAVRHSLPVEVSNAVLFNQPRTRASVISSSSNGSSEGYIRPSDIASSPPPLPARPLSGAGSFKRLSEAKFTTAESKSYLDLNYHSTVEATYTTSRFQHEPLYQFYTAKVERAALFHGDCSSEDDYEVINDGNQKQEFKLMRPTAMELVTPADGRRTLWCELPEVMSSGILNKISGQERKIQEAMFEVLTSEASYLRSLDVLVSHFKNCPEFNTDDDTRVITRREAKVLFSDILPVKKFAELFLADLERRWQESVKISGITDIVLKHAESFAVYVKYCSNQIYQDRMLRSLKENNSRFMDVVNRLESSPVCQSLAMHSFLMLPMQRITRLPLLLDAIFNRLEYGSPHWEECKAALAIITKVVAECNEGARKMERLEEMLILSRQLDFREVKAIPLLSSSRWLVKKGELTRLTWRESDAKLTFGRKISKHTLYFFLFSDLLVVTKRKSDDQHLVLDYCPRNMVQVLELENANRFPGRILDGYKNLLIMTMLQNHENRTVEMVLSCPLESDRTRWIEAVTPRISDNPDEQVYEEWDCPQVQATHSYLAVQSDEISLEIADVINVLKKTSDGWYQGERLRDGEKGWFPGNHTIEVASAHVRARNLRQRYRLLVISGSFIEKEKKEREEKSEKKKERRKTITMKESL